MEERNYIILKREKGAVKICISLKEFRRCVFNFFSSPLPVLFLTLLFFLLYVLFGGFFLVI